MKKSKLILLFFVVTFSMNFCSKSVDVVSMNEFQDKILSRVLIHNKNLRWKVDERVKKHLRNKQVLKITRRAKYILIFFDDCCLMIHLGMSGKLRIQNIQFVISR